MRQLSSPPPPFLMGTRIHLVCIHLFGGIRAVSLCLKSHRLEILIPLLAFLLIKFKVIFSYYQIKY